MYSNYLQVVSWSIYDPHLMGAFPHFDSSNCIHHNQLCFKKKTRVRKLGNKILKTQTFYEFNLSILQKKEEKKSYKLYPTTLYML